MHESHVNEFFANALYEIQGMDSMQKQQQAISYIAGFLCHYVGDYICHPYVYARIGHERGKNSAYIYGMHAALENDIDTIEEADYVQEITDERITREIKDKNYVIFVEPTLFYLDSLKNVSKDDDFYTTVDDATFYMTMASDLALEKRIDTINIKIGEILKIGEKIIQVSKDNPWTLILYKQGGKTKELYPIEIQIDDKIIDIFFNE